MNQVLQKIHKYVSLVIREACASKLGVHKARCFKTYISMLVFGHTGSMCHKKFLGSTKYKITCLIQLIFESQASPMTKY